MRGSRLTTRNARETPSPPKKSGWVNMGDLPRDPGAGKYGASTSRIGQEPTRERFGEITPGPVGLPVQIRGASPTHVALIGGRSL